MKHFLIGLLTGLQIFSTPVFAVSSAVDVKAGNQFPGIKYSENYIKNSGFESNKANVTDASSIATLTTTTPVSGAKSLLIDATSSGQVVKILGNIIKQKGANCSGDFYYIGDASLYKAYVLQGSTKVSGEVTLTNSPSNTVPVTLNFPCGDGTTASDIAIESTSASAAAIRVDDFYAGLATNIGTVAQATFLGSIKYPRLSTSCTWTTTATTVASFAAVTACPVATATGSVTAPATKIPGLIIPSAGAGHYEFVAMGGFNHNGSGEGFFQFADQANNKSSVVRTYLNSASNLSVPVITGSIDLQSSISNWAVDLRSYLAGGTSTSVSAEGETDFVINVYYFPSQSQAVVKMSDIRVPTITKLTSGSGTYTVPAGVTQLKIRMVGGGGGGGGSSNSSCNGTQIGGSGGSTTFGSSLLTAGGGTGGVCSDVSMGGVGGTATISAPAVGTGIAGTMGGGNTLTNVTSALNYTASGAGGNAPYYNGGGGSVPAGFAGNAGLANTGGGGSGGGVGAGVTRSGSGGGSGSFIEAQISPLSATYAYSIGAGGTAGVAGTSGNAGGAGGSGYIEITEIYGWNLPIGISALPSSSNFKFSPISAASGTNAASSSGTQTITFDRPIKYKITLNVLTAHSQAYTFDRTTWALGGTATRDDYFGANPSAQGNEYEDTNVNSSIVIYGSASAGQTITIGVNYQCNYSTAGHTAYPSYLVEYMN